MEEMKHTLKLGYNLYSTISNWSQPEIKFILCYSYLQNVQKMFLHNENLFSGKTIGQYLGLDTQSAYKFPSKIIPRLSSRTFLFRGKDIPCFDSVTYRKRKFDIEFSLEAFTWLFLSDDKDSCVDVDIRSLRYFSNTGFSLSLYLRLLLEKSSIVVLSKDETTDLFFANEPSCRDNVSVQHQLLKKAIRSINSCSDLAVNVTPVKSESRITAWSFEVKKLEAGAYNKEWYKKEISLLRKYIKESDLNFISDRVVIIIAFFSKDYAMFCRLVDKLREWILLWGTYKSYDSGTDKYIVMLLLTCIQGEDFVWYVHPKTLSVLNYSLLKNILDVNNLIDIITDAEDYYSLLNAMNL